MSGLAFQHFKCCGLLRTDFTNFRLFVLQDNTNRNRQCWIFDRECPAFSFWRVSVELFNCLECSKYDSSALHDFPFSNSREECVDELESFTGKGCASPHLDMHARQEDPLVDVPREDFICEDQSKE
jgi:hypothetical protein